MKSPIEVAQQVLQEARAINLTTQVLGGVAFYLLCPSAREVPFARSYNDVDFAVSNRRTAQFTQVAAAVGLEPDTQFNALNGSTRMLFYHQEMPIDVFVGTFEQCHKLDLEPALEQGGDTLPPDYLLLTKLQVVKLTEKDISDMFALLLDFSVPEKSLPTGLVERLAGHDWGWYTTISDTLEKMRQHLPDLPDHLQPRAEDAVNHWNTVIQNVPKSLSWRMRARVGRRVRWYEDPEEN